MKETPLNGRMLVGGCPEGQEYNTQLLYFTCSSLGESGDRVYMISDCLLYTSTAFSSETPMTRIFIAIIIPKFSAARVSMV